jgi:hypothetical protein
MAEFETRRIIIIVVVVVMSIVSILLPVWAAQKFAIGTTTAANLDDVISTALL